MNSYDQLIEKWSPVLNESSAGEIQDHHRRAVTAAILENQEVAMREEQAQHEGFGGLTEAHLLLQLRLLQTGTLRYLSRASCYA